MTKRNFLRVAGFVSCAVLLVGTPASAAQHATKRDIHRDAKDIKHDSRDLKRDTREVRQDKKDIRHDIKSGN